MVSIEDKILGVEPEEEKVKKEANKSFDANSLWTVSKKGCGTCVMNGRMVHEMLDFDAKREILAGKKEVKSGDFTFKLKR